MAIDPVSIGIGVALGSAIGYAINRAKVREAEISAREQVLEARSESQIVTQKALSRLQSREEKLEAKESELLALERETNQKVEEADRTLDHISGMSRAEAVELQSQIVIGEANARAKEKLERLDSEIQEVAEAKSRKILLSVMERNHTEYLTESTTAVVHLPNEDMKGRIIGREGRNIRTFEQVTGVDLIIDDTPEAVVISSFDPVRREVARLALMNLMVDGRIHPGKIEELHEKALTEVNKVILESGRTAAIRAGVEILPDKVLNVMGQLRFRSSYAQNVLDHSVEVAFLSSTLAHELGCNVDVARLAGFVHDIGKGLGPEWDGPHALTGMEFLKQQGLSEAICHAVGAHHHEIDPESNEAKLVIIGDSLSAARPGARRESLDNYMKRLSALETVANGFEGVDRSYVVQAGREIRVFVEPEKMSDLESTLLADEIAKKIEATVQYPGQVKVTVIRESRFQGIAK